MSSHNIRLSNIVIEGSLLSVASGSVNVSGGTLTATGLISSGTLTSVSSSSNTSAITGLVGTTSPILTVQNINSGYTNSIINLISNTNNTSSNFLRGESSSVERFSIKTNGSSLWTGAMTISNTTASSSISTGALIVGGGIGVTGNIYSSGNLNISTTNTTNAIQAINGSQTSNTFVIGRAVSTGNYGFLKFNYTSDNSSSNYASLGLTSTDYIRIFNSTGHIDVRSTTSSSSSTTGSLVVRGGVGVTGDIFYSGSLRATSDIRKKNVVEKIDNCLEKINKLTCIKYIRNDIENPQVEIGLIAQEVKEQFPELVSEDKDGYNYLDYSRLTAVLVKSIQELIKKIEYSD